MSTLFSFGIKIKDGSWKNLTGSINDTTDQYGNNVTIYETQTPEQRKSKEAKKYFANGKVVWTDGKIVVAEKKELKKQDQRVETITPIDDLPF